MCRQAACLAPLFVPLGRLGTSAANKADDGGWVQKVRDVCVELSAGEAGCLQGEPKAK